MGPWTNRAQDWLPHSLPNIKTIRVHSIVMKPSEPASAHALFIRYKRLSGEGGAYLYVQGEGGAYLYVRVEMGPVCKSWVKVGFIGMSWVRAGPIGMSWVRVGPIRMSE